MDVCLKGHPLTGDNIKLNGKSGARCCRTCCNASKRAFHHRHKARLNPIQRAWAQTEEGKRVQRNYFYKRHYGITLERYEEMFKEQGGVCAISGLPSPNGQNSKSRLNVDHDHTTNQVRQLLHPDVNTALGFFQDNPEWLRRAADYIEYWKDKKENSLANMQTVGAS